MKLQLLAKSSVCPGIITIIWALITSDTNPIEEQDDDTNEAEGEDDTLTELLNNTTTYDALYKMVRERGGIEAFKKSSKPIQIELRQNTDIFT